MSSILSTRSTSAKPERSHSLKENINILPKGGDLPNDSNFFNSRRRSIQPQKENMVNLQNRELSRRVPKIHFKEGGSFIFSRSNSRPTINVDKNDKSNITKRSQSPAPTKPFVVYLSNKPLTIPKEFKFHGRSSFSLKIQ